MAQGLRLAGEFVAGIIVGALLGTLVDYLTGARPWGLIVFVLLGFVAGILNVIRAAGRLPPPSS